MFEDLKKNILQEKAIVLDMKTIVAGYQSDEANRELYLSSLNALARQLDLLNNVVPDLLKAEIPSIEEDVGEVKKSVKTEEEKRKREMGDKEKGIGDKEKGIGDKEKVGGDKGIKSYKTLVLEKKVEDVSQKKKRDVSKKKLSLPELKPLPKKNDIVKMSYVSPRDGEKKFVTISKKDRGEFLKKLKLSEDSLKSAKKVTREKVSLAQRKANPYVSFSSRYFGQVAQRLSPQFDDLSKDLKKSNLPVLLSGYLAMAIMSCCIAFGVGILAFVVLVIVTSNWIFAVLPFGFVGLVMAGFYLYPASEASTVHKNISYELPFVTIHMAAIAGSNITPVKIFKIIAGSREYPNIGAEMRKVIVQIDVYGYDMVSSLKNVAKITNNDKLSELFSGLAANISSGGELKNYLEKKSESFLNDYRLERQKYSALAGTFMDVYISILIAGPLVFMMMFIIMNVANIGVGGLSIQALMTLAIGGIIVANVIFIFVLNVKQPRV